MIKAEIPENAYVALATKEVVQSNLRKSLNQEISVDGATFRFFEREGRIVLEKKLPNGGFAALDDAALNTLTPAQQDALLIQVAGKDALKRYAKVFETPIAQNSLFASVKDMKLKEYFEKFDKFALHTGNAKDYSWAGARIPKHMYDWTVGKMVSEIGHSFQLPTWRKVEVLRTLYTGRSSHGHLWSHEHGKLPTAWTPSLPVVGATMVVTASEFAAKGWDQINSTEDAVNYAWNHKVEIKNNYFDWIYYGWL